MSDRDEALVRATLETAARLAFWPAEKLKASLGSNFHTACSEASEAIRAIDAAEVLAKVGDGWQTPAARDVLAERRRQIEVEGWSESHDDSSYRLNELTLAAMNYLGGTVFRLKDADPRIQRPDVGGVFTGWWQWPWSEKWWKPTDRRRDLVKAGALILSEIERLDRATPLQEAPND